MIARVILLTLLSHTAALHLKSNYRDNGPKSATSEDVTLTDRMVEEKMQLDPDWDEPFPLVEQTGLQLSKINLTGTHQFLFRKAMWDKVKSLKNHRVKIMRPDTFNRKFNNHFVNNLPEEGAVIFVLDHPFASICNSPRSRSALLDNPKVLAVAAENWIGPSHPKVTVLPIGFESRLMTGKYGKVLDTFLDLIKNPTAIDQRKHTVQSDAHLHKFGRSASGFRNDRADMQHHVEQSAIDDWYTHHIDLDSHFRNHVAQAKLALCPEGNGMDTHRFYHNYALRTRCIVREGPLSEMHRQFPGTIVVNHWNEVTAQNIQKWSKEHVAHDPAMVTSDYWINKVLDKANIAHGQTHSFIDSDVEEEDM